MSKLLKPEELMAFGDSDIERYQNLQKRAHIIDAELGYECGEHETKPGEQPGLDLLTISSDEIDIPSDIEHLYIRGNAIRYLIEHKECKVHIHGNTVLHFKSIKEKTRLLYKNFRFDNSRNLYNHLRKSIDIIINNENYNIELIDIVDIMLNCLKAFKKAFGIDTDELITKCNELNYLVCRHIEDQESFNYLVNAVKDINKILENSEMN